MFWRRKNGCKKEDKAGPSWVIKVESNDEVQPDDESEEFNTSEEETMALWNFVDTQPDDEE